jgi:hypothetical protein
LYLLGAVPQVRNRTAAGELNAGAHAPSKLFHRNPKTRNPHHFADLRERRWTRAATTTKTRATPKPPILDSGLTNYAG